MGRRARLRPGIDETLCMPIQSVKVSYMTYSMKIQEERDEARPEGMIEAVKSLMNRKGCNLRKDVQMTIY